MRRLFPVAFAGSLALTLGACAGATPETTTSLSLPAKSSETPSPGLTDSAPAQPEAGGEAGPIPTTEDCLLVAAGVSSMLLAPLNFMGSEDQKTMSELTDQLDDLRTKVPDELEPHFDRVADAAEGGPPGAGQFDEPAYRAALQPVQEWLQKHCSEPGR